MSRRILVVLSEYGFWGEELIGPYEKLTEAGFVCHFYTQNGKRAHPLPPSMDPTFIDPPLGRAVTSPEMAEIVKNLDAGTVLNAPKAITGILPERPYTSAPDYLRKLESYNNCVDAAVKNLISEYDALLLVGGSGPVVDMVNNQRLHEIILGFYKADKPIAAECYGVACLAFARDFETRRSIIKGKHVTGHCLEYDYHDGTGFLGVDFNMGPPPYPLEFILRDATAPDGEYIGNFGHEISALVDYPFVTGRSTADSYKTGELLVKVLNENLKRYGW